MGGAQHGQPSLEHHTVQTRTLNGMTMIQLTSLAGSNTHVITTHHVESVHNF